MTQSPIAHRSAPGSPLSPRVDLHAIPHSQFFLTPPTVSASPQSSTASLRKSLHSTHVSRGKKRSLDAEDSHSSNSLRRLDSPPPLTSDRHRLAPHDDGRRNFAKYCQAPVPEHAPFGKQPQSLNRGIQQIDATQSDEGDDGTSAIPGAYNQSPGDRPVSPSIRDGLGNAIYRVAGIAGKVWQNWSTTFKGFYAGGGPGYEVRQIDYPGGTRDCWQVTKDDAYWQQNSLPLTPGGFPHDDFIPDYMSQDHIQTTPQRAVKRSRKSSGSAEKWVMVGPNKAPDSSPSRPAQRRPPRPASSRRKGDLQNVSRRHVLEASQQAVNGSPRGRSSRASFASARPGTPKSQSSLHNSPQSLEMQRQTAKIKRQEAEEEANLQRFNLQLKAMIKEGREALGTRIEIEDDVDENARDVGFT